MARRIAAIEVRRHHPSRVSAGVCRADSALAVGGGSKFAVHTFRGSFGGGDHSGLGAIVGLNDPAKYVAFPVTHLPNHDVSEFAGSKTEQKRIVSVARRHLGSLLATGTEYRRFLAKKRRCERTHTMVLRVWKGSPSGRAAKPTHTADCPADPTAGCPISRVLCEKWGFSRTPYQLSGARSRRPQKNVGRSPKLSHNPTVTSDLAHSPHPIGKLSN
jgi:hypothetical protein